MSLDASKIIIPGYGNVLQAEPDTLPFNPAQFVIGNPSTYGESWNSLGHTSAENPPEFEKDGGDANQKRTWEQDAVDVSYESVAWSGAVNALEMTQKTFALAQPDGAWNDEDQSYEVSGDGKIEKALFFIFVQGAKRAGLYFPRCSIGLGDAPSVDIEEFFEIPMGFQALSSNTLLAADGRPLKMKWYPVRPFSAAVAVLSD
ncbi:phage tail tube protein [Kocuria sp.]|uniref:phage tail tube protein n=1 Tax=Kocuria sp. TaxID=1871328 RepID=UPI0026DFFE74|nr:hypothetical protein [Kocuria sp.]MDO5619271.1 hypothetical protein [Kocuria sp.]